MNHLRANSSSLAGKGGFGRGADTNLAAGTSAVAGGWAERDWIPGGPGRGVKGRRRRQAARDWLMGKRAGLSCGVPLGLSSRTSPLLTGSLGPCLRRGPTS